MKKSIHLAILANQIGATLDPPSRGDLPILGIATLAGATSEEISFFTNGLYRDELAKTEAAAVILDRAARRYCKTNRLVMENPYLGYARAARLFNPRPCLPKGIHPSAWVSVEANVNETMVSIGPTAVIEAGASLGREVYIGPGCVVGSGVSIDDDCHLFANVTLCEGTRLGIGVIIHPGAVIGSDGFGNANDAGKWVKVPQLGGVVIGNGVEIGANTTIDKGALEDTVIGDGVKLDNQIQIAHNVQIGEHTAIAGCVGVAGSTRIGRYCMIGGAVGIAGHLELVDYVHVTGGSIVLQSVREPGVYSSGTPLEKNGHWHRNFHRFKHLNEMARRLKTLERVIMS